MRTRARENVSEASSTTSSSLVHGASRSPAPTSSEAVRSPTCDVERDDAVDQQQAEPAAQPRQQRDQVELAGRDLLAPAPWRAAARPAASAGRARRRARRRRRTGNSERPGSRRTASSRRTGSLRTGSGNGPGGGSPAPCVIVSSPRAGPRDLHPGRRRSSGVGAGAIIAVRCRSGCASAASSARPSPTPTTQRSLERGLRELVFGEYLDAPPGRWLVWHGRGPLGPTRYACARAPRRPRGLRARALRHGRLASVEDAAVRDDGRRSSDTERAIAKGGLSSMPKWGLPS